MKSLTDISGILSGNKIFVPDYQRAYSWDTDPKDLSKTKKVNTFLRDLLDYIKS